jgi:hypothetical protein
MLLITPVMCSMSEQAQRLDQLEAMLRTMAACAALQVRPYCVYWVQRREGVEELLFVVAQHAWEGRLEDQRFHTVIA